MQNTLPGICRRLAEVRLKHFGPRGKTRFAAELGIGPSSYHRYEIDRTPPAELLALAAQRTGTNLHWLLTGDGEMAGARVNAEMAIGSDGQFATLTDRVNNLLARSPELARSLTGFLDLLENVADDFPVSKVGHGQKAANFNDLLPVVGGTAAGPARFWEEVTSEHGGAKADSRIEELLRASARRSVCEAELITPNVSSQVDGPVALVQWSQPDELGFLEFISCPALKAKFPQAVCWRIDGDSMSPRFRDGDLVITSGDCPAADGHPCVARQSGQIGVNCKIFKEDGDEVLLVPVNENYRIERLARTKLQWAHRVLYSVRLAGNR